MSTVSSSVLLRLATPADVPLIRALIDASVRGLSTDYYSKAQIESALKYVFGVDSQLIADGTYYVVVSNGAIAAAGGWSRRATLYGGDQYKAAADPLLDPTVDAARIRAFFVHPEFARRGLARLLFDECHAAARRHGFQRLELGATLPGVPLYAALGFVPIEETASQMPDGNDLPLVHMTRPVDPIT